MSYAASMAYFLTKALKGRRSSETGLGRLKPDARNGYL
jgi:hypothetical protein